VAEQANIAKADADIKLGKVRAAVEAGRLEIDRYNSAIAAFRAENEAKSESNRSAAEMYRADASIMESISKATSDAFRVQLEELRMGINTILETVKVNIETARLQLESMKAVAQTRISASQTGSGVYSNMVSGALSAVNALAAQIETSEV
jgi:predicted secreted protein